MKRTLGVCATLMALCATPGLAATLQVDGTGQLIGATDVDVGGSLFDVSFVEGTCVSIFDGCNSVSDFTFTTEADAEAAAQALSNQVFIDGPAGNFDSEVGLTFGISDVAARGTIITPWNISGAVVQVENFANGDGSFRSDLFSGGVFNVTRDTTPRGDLVYALWSAGAIVAPVPVPASVLLMLSAMGGLFGLRRFRRA